MPATSARPKVPAVTSQECVWTGPGAGPQDPGTEGTTREPRPALHGTGLGAVPRRNATPGTLRRTHQGPSGGRGRGPGTPGEQARRPALTGPRPGLSSRARGRQSRGGTGYSHSGREGRQKEETLGEGRWSGVEGRGGLQAEGHICDEKQDFILGQWTLPPGLAPVPSRTLLPFL